MEMFRPDHLASDDELIFLSGFFQNLKEQIAPGCGVHQWLSVIAGAGNKMPITLSVDSYQSFRHGLIVHAHPLRLNESCGKAPARFSRKEWGTLGYS